MLNNIQTNKNVFPKKKSIYKKKKLITKIQLQKNFFVE